jgi:hypothetical protein
MSNLNNVVGYLAYIRGGVLYSGRLIFGGGCYICNEVSVSTCGGLIHGGLIFRGLRGIPKLRGRVVVVKLRQVRQVMIIIDVYILNTLIKI